jgi:hypothetical protein
MTTSPRLGFTYLEEGETIPETAVNEIARYLEAAAGLFRIEDRNLSAPDGSEFDGAAYLVSGTGTGAWAGHDGDIAYFLGTSWAFFEVFEGSLYWIRDENKFLVATSNTTFDVVPVGVSAGFSAAMVKKSADQTAADYSASLFITWNTEVYDTDGFAPTASTVTISIASPGVVTWTGHNFANNSPIVLTTTGALPTGFTAGTTYYVVNQAANTFQLSATQGGAAINTSGTQSGTHTATNYSRLTVPAGLGINYIQTGCTVALANVTTSLDVSLFLSKNGSTSFNGSTRQKGEIDATGPGVSLCSGPIPVVAGDYFEILMSMATDTSIDVTAATSNFWIKAVG